MTNKLILTALSVLVSLWLYANISNAAFSVEKDTYMVNRPFIPQMNDRY